MAKHITQIWDSWATPSLEIVHVLGSNVVPALPFDIHLIYLFDAPSNYADLLVPCPPPVDWDPAVHEPCASQLEMTKLLMSFPNLIGDACSACHQSYLHAYKLRFNIVRDGQYPWNCPACPADGAADYHWTPDQWPPAWYWT
jgi:hypothetical protein